MRKPDFCICENKDADQLRGNREADQRLCFHYTDSTIRLLPISEISSLWPSCVVVQPGLCGTWSETPKTGFLRTRLILYMISPVCIIRMKDRLAGQPLDILYRSTYACLSADLPTCLHEKGATYCTSNNFSSTLPCLSLQEQIDGLVTSLKKGWYFLIFLLSYYVIG